MFWRKMGQLQRLRVLHFELIETIDALAAIHKDIEDQGGGFTPIAREVREFLARLPKR